MTDVTAEKISTRIIAVAHQKGGTGKTTTVCALAASFAALKPGFKVCVIDLDPQGATTVHLGGEGPFQTGSYDAVIAGKPLAETWRKSQIENCVLIPATSRLILSELDLASRTLSFDAVAARLKDPTLGFNLIIIDCPSGFGMISTMIMTIADLVVIPTPPLFFATRALRETISYLNRLRRDARVYTAVVLTMFDADSSIHSVMAAKIRRDWGDLVLPIEIPFEDNVEQAAVESRLLQTQFTTSGAAKAYQTLMTSLAFRLGLIDREPRLEVSRPSHGGRNMLDADTPSSDDDERIVVPKKNPVQEPEIAPQQMPEHAPDAAAETHSASENLPPIKDSPPTSVKARLSPMMKVLIICLLLVVTGIVIYVAIQIDMLMWVMLVYLILTLIFFPILVMLLV